MPPALESHREPANHARGRTAPALVAVLLVVGAPGGGGMLVDHAALSACDEFAGRRGPRRHAGPIRFEPGRGHARVGRPVVGATPGPTAAPGATPTR